MTSRPGGHRGISTAMGEGFAPSCTSDATGILPLSAGLFYCCALIAMKDCLSPSTSATNGSARWDLAGAIQDPPGMKLAAVIMIGPRVRENCLIRMALSFSSALPRTKCDRPVAASHRKVTLAKPVDAVATKGTEEGRFNAVSQMRRRKNPCYGGR